MFPYSNEYPQDKSVVGYSGPTTLIFSEGQIAPGIFETVDSRTLVRTAIQRILGTSRGQRVMRPLFGTSLADLLFEISDDITEKDIKDEIINTINTEEPRINVQLVEIMSDADNHTIKCSIAFKYKNSGNDDSLVYTITKNG